MDPQACLAQIIEIVRRTHTTPRSLEDLDHDWSELTTAFESLHDWLKKGGFPPVATGPIFGNSPVAVGYPGMTLNSPARHEQRPIKHVRSSPSSSFRFAILVKDRSGEDFSAWVFHSYDAKGSLIQEWDFHTA